MYTFLNMVERFGFSVDDLPGYCNTYKYTQDNQF